MTTNHMPMAFASAALIAALAVLPFFALAKGGDHRGDADAQATILGAPVQVAITNGGNVFVRGAKVTAVTGGTISAATTWGATTMNWTVVTDGSTAFGTTPLGEITIGDSIAFAGSWNPNGAALNVIAVAVKDLTRPNVVKTVTGTVESVASSSIVLHKGDRNDNRGNKKVTVQVTGGTTITVNGAATTTLAGIKTDDRIKATGTLSADGSVLTATQIVVSPVQKLEKGFRDLLKRFLGNGFGILKVKDRDGDRDDD